MPLQLLDKREDVLRAERADDFLKVVLDADGSRAPIFSELQEVVQVHIRKGPHEQLAVEPVREAA